MIRRMKGVRDILAPESRVWTAVEAEARRVFSRLGYDEIRLPIAEPTELFVRGVGEGTDIVGKEMYTFCDRKGRSLTLRPEGTAGVARAFLENGLGQWPQPVRLSYFGPMFRYEKMQRGRYRQFAQAGIEILGAASAAADLEVLLALYTFLSALGFDDLVIVLNNLGDPEDRQRFVTLLKSELSPVKEELCADCARRWDENPLRILDCKQPRCGELVERTTPIAEIINDDARQHGQQVTAGLEALGIPYERAPRLVRGLDYYLRTVFEVVSPELGRDKVICGGGRYDRLISDLGGPPVPGVGFAIGLDRLIEVLPEKFRSSVLEQRSVALIPLAAQADVQALLLARQLLELGITARTEVTGRSLKSSLRWATKVGARVAVIIGEDELAAGEVTLRDLDRGEQERLSTAQAVADISSLFASTTAAATEGA